MFTKILGGSTLALAIALALTFLWGKAGWRDAASYKLAAETLKVSYQTASAAAEAEQKAYYASISARLRVDAENSETSHAQLLEGSQRATDGFIAANRVRGQTAGSPSGGTGGSAQGGNPAVPDDTAAETELVAVKPDDVHACAADYAYAKSAYDFAQGLIVDNMAEPLAIPDPAFAN